MVSIIFIALGLKALESVSATAHHDLDDALTGVALVAPYGGVAAHRLGHVGFRHCNVGRGMSTDPCAVGLLLHIPSAWRLPAIVALVMVAVLLARRSTANCGDSAPHVRRSAAT